jgi:hypothetical protein
LKVRGEVEFMRIMDEKYSGRNGWNQNIMALLKTVEKLQWELKIKVKHKKTL